MAWHDRADIMADKIAVKTCHGRRELYDGETFPEKPKRMRWQTYHRLEERYYDLKDLWAADLIQQFGIVCRSRGIRTTSNRH